MRPALAVLHRDRILSGVTRAELVRHGDVITGRAPVDVLPAMSDGDVRDAARADLGLTSMASARRRGEKVSSSRLRTALVSWRDARHTVRLAGSGQ